MIKYEEFCLLGYNTMQSWLGLFNPEDGGMIINHFISNGIFDSTDHDFTVLLSLQSVLMRFALPFIPSVL
jgi:hypothetical protein